MKRFLSLLAAGTALTCASGSKSSSVTEDAVYVGAVTDEALDYLLALDPVDSGERVTFEAPTEGATVDAGASLTVRFSAVEFARLDGAPLPLSPVPPQPARPDPAPVRRPLPSVFELLSVPAAYAHGTPYTGAGYHLAFKSASGQELLHVFGDRTEYVIESPELDPLREAAQPITLEVVAALFERNEVTSDGGPFLVGRVGFRLE